jgi:hypothetical protein
MQDIVTLFGSRPQEFTRTVDVTVGGRDAQVLIHSPENDKSISFRRCKNKDELDRQVMSALDKLAAGGGGVVACVLPDNRGWIVQVESRRGRDFQPATQAIMLRPGYAAVSLDLESNGPIRLDAGARLILPTTDSGTRNLVELLARLDQFSPDVTWTTLAALCAPSLDLRVRRLEERVGKSRTPPAGNGTVAAMVDQWRAVWSLVRARPLAWSLSTLSALLAIAIVWDAAHGFETSRRAIARLKREPAAAATATASSSPTALVVPPVTMKETAVASVASQATTPLYAALDALRGRLQRTQDQGLLKLYKTHFKTLADMTQGHEGEVLRDPSIAYGLVWLLGVQTKNSNITLPNDGPIVGNGEHEKAARVALKALRDNGKLTKDDYALLVDVTCNAFPENLTVNKPGLPAATNKERADLPRGWCQPGVPVRGLQALADGIAP